MFIKSATLVISSALLSSAIIFHAWYPTKYGPEATRIAWINQCVAIKEDRRRAIRLSDIPESKPRDFLAEDADELVEKYASVISRTDDERRFELEQNCMATYAIVMRGAR